MNKQDETRILSVLKVLDERQRRFYLAAEAEAMGRGGISAISKLTGVSRNTIAAGRADYEDVLKGGSTLMDLDHRIREEGGGRHTIVKIYPDIEEALLKLVDESSYGNPDNPLRWTTKSTRHLSDELNREGYKISYKTVGTLLVNNGFTLQENAKLNQVGNNHPDRDSQFKFINDRAKSFLEKGLPVISIDCKKKEKIGLFKNEGKDWHEKGNPIKTNDHDFTKNVVAPYGVYDIQNNEGFVNVGISHDTAEFAVESIRQWWLQMGSHRYPQADKLFITADGGGSNGSRNRLWKCELQKLADILNIQIFVSHFPPGTSKWNKIEHRLFSQISKSWANQPLETYETVVNLIGATTAKSNTGPDLHVEARLDTKVYETGIKVSDAILASVLLFPEEFHGEWNYSIQQSLVSFLYQNLNSERSDKNDV